MSEKAKIREFIFENYMFGEFEDALDNDDSFLEKGTIDSMGVLELIAFVEETYDIEIEDNELIPDNFDSVNKLVAYIKDKNCQIAVLLNGETR